MQDGFDAKDGRDGPEAHDTVRSRRPVVWRRLHAIFMNRLQERRSWVVSFPIMRPFGPSRATVMLRAGHAPRLGRAHGPRI